MENSICIRGVVTAVLTPLDQKGNINIVLLQDHIRVLENDGSNAILIMGTTGEGPSFSAAERKAALEAAIPVAGQMKVIAQTGCASLAETIDLTRHAFGAGLSYVTVIPPFFFKGVTDDGLFEYYRRIIEEAVPDGGSLMLYHIPQVTQVPVSFNLIERLLNKYGNRIGGIKDSAGDLEHLKELCRRFPKLPIFTGNDQLILEALQAGAAGCVTGVVNTFSRLAAAIFQAFLAGDQEASGYQQQLTMVWKILDRYQPYTTLLKGLTALRYQNFTWLDVRPPLDPMSPEQLDNMIGELRRLELPDEYSWIRKPFPIVKGLMETKL